MKLQAEAEHEARLAAERLGLPFLVYRDGEGRQRIHPLERGRRSVTIGRRDEADAIWLATGIFVSIVNIFVSLLNIFSGR